MISRWKRTDEELPSESGRYLVWDAYPQGAYFDPSTDEWTDDYRLKLTPGWWRPELDPPSDYRDDDRTEIRLNQKLAIERHAALKSQHLDRLVIVRTGDFYETFNADAEKLAGVCEFVITVRISESRKVPMCGFPFYMLDHTIEKLLAGDHKVAIAETDKDVRLLG